MQSLSLILISLLLISLVWVVQSFWSGSRLRRAYARLPHPKGLPILGNVQEVVGFSKHKFVYEAQQKLGGIFVLKFLTLKVSTSQASSV